jgi:hypothetical protein
VPIPTISSISSEAKGAPANIDNPNVVIEVAYDSEDYFPLPVDFLRKDKDSKG